MGDLAPGYYCCSAHYFPLPSSSESPAPCNMLASGTLAVNVAPQNIDYHSAMTSALNADIQHFTTSKFEGDGRRPSYEGRVRVRRCYPNLNSRQGMISSFIPALKSAH
jgi:hypothetical protein